MDIPLSKEGRSLYYSLITEIPPKNQSDRTSFRRMISWLEREVIAGRLCPEVFRAVLTIAIETKCAEVKNRHAVFTAAFQREFGYGRKA